MARVTTMAGIASISGRVGNYCFRTMKSSGKVYMHLAGSKKPKTEKMEMSAAIVAQRERFSAITKMVAQMRKNGTKKNQKQLWKIASEAYDAANQL